MTGRKRRRIFSSARPFVDLPGIGGPFALKIQMQRPGSGNWEEDIFHRVREGVDEKKHLLWYVASCRHIYTLYLLEVMLFSVLKIQLQVIGYRYVMCFYDLRAAEGKPLQGWRETDEVLEMSINLRLVPFAPWFLQTFCLYHNLI